MAAGQYVSPPTTVNELGPGCTKGFDLFCKLHLVMRNTQNMRSPSEIQPSAGYAGVLGGVCNK